MRRTRALRTKQIIIIVTTPEIYTKTSIFIVTKDDVNYGASWLIPCKDYYSRERSASDYICPMLEEIYELREEDELQINKVTVKKTTVHYYSEEYVRIILIVKIE